METAYSAMRNLSNADYGGRPLRVDWADHELRNSEAVTKVIIIKESSSYYCS